VDERAIIRVGQPFGLAYTLTKGTGTIFIVPYFRKDRPERKKAYLPCTDRTMQSSPA